MLLLVPTNIYIKIRRIGTQKPRKQILTRLNYIINEVTKHDEEKHRV